MKPEELFDAIGMAEDTMIEKANEIKMTKKSKKFFRRKGFYGAVAAVLIIALGIGILGNDKRTESISKVYAMAEAVYPECYPKPSEEEYKKNDDWETFANEFDKWYEDYLSRNAYFTEDIDINEFLTKSIEVFLTGKDNENIAYSPLNVYIALGILAEITDGESRKQILEVLGTNDIEDLRKNITGIWNSNYCDDGVTSMILANSLWLSDLLTYREDTLKTLAETYYVSSYSGEMGTDKYNQALQTWLNEQTKGLLKDFTKQIELNRGTLLALASTVYYKASWVDSFKKEKNTEGVFYAKNKEVSCEFMNESEQGIYYFGDRFSAVEKQFSYPGGSMWFILPEEGVTPKELLSDTGLNQFIQNGRKWANKKSTRINLSVPKFDITSQTELTNGLKKLGIKDVFKSNLSDFTSITQEKAAVSRAQHDVRIKIDEDGCTAAAYTAIILDGAEPSKSEVDFILNRPFLFVITSDVGLPLFVGIMNTP